MPPQLNPAAAAPFLTDTFPSMLIPSEVGLIRIPDIQLVVAVTPWTQPLLLAINRIPSA